MVLKPLKLALLLLAIGATACSESEPKSNAEAYVTNAEKVLQRLNSEYATAIAFQVKPPNAASCKHMYIEFGSMGADGKWASTIALNPGKDKRDNFGQYQLSNEIHFSEIDAEGDFGVLALGCKPHNKPPIMIKSLIATFDVMPGKLNYIGELALVPAGKQPTSFYSVKVADRSDFALDQIRAQLPELESYLAFNVMEKFEIEMSQELRDKLDTIPTFKRPNIER